MLIRTISFYFMGKRDNDMVNEFHFFLFVFNLVQRMKKIDATNRK